MCICQQLMLSTTQPCDQCVQAADVPAGRAAAVWTLAAGAAWAPLNTNTEDWLAGFEGTGSTFIARFTGAAATVHTITHDYKHVHVYEYVLHDILANQLVSSHFAVSHFAVYLYRVRVRVRERVSGRVRVRRPDSALHYTTPRNGEVGNGEVACHQPTMVRLSIFCSSNQFCNSNST